MAEGPGTAKPLIADIGSLGVCTLIWSTTWRAIKLQLGPVPPLDSVVYRFALAAGLLFLWCAVTRRSLALNRRQHLDALGQGFCGFSLQYALVYLAEEKIASGAMAVIFAATPFVNLVLFRFALGQKASGRAWIATLMGLAGVAALSLSQVSASPSGGGAAIGVLIAFGGVFAAAFGNFFAARGQAAGAAVAPSTAWAMGYGALMVAAYVLATGHAWRFEPSVRYVGALVYLAGFGSVIAFVTYYALARRRGYAFASYVAALTPPAAMLISTLTEGARWGLAALAGLALVLAGQALLMGSARG